MGVPFMTDEFAQAARQLLNSWPDTAEQANERKPEAYWAYFDRKRKSFGGTLALGVSGIPGADGARYLALTFDDSGTVTRAQVLPQAGALAAARIALECTYQTWLDLAGGYDIGKAMTYHKLPLRAGGAADLLRCAYFVHEVIVAVLRAGASLPEPAA